MIDTHVLGVFEGDGVVSTTCLHKLLLVFHGIERDQLIILAHAEALKWSSSCSLASDGVCCWN